MKFIYQDLLNFFKEQPSREALSKKLFQLGHEHELDGDIFDMEITPNRGDCLSLIGLSRDLNNFYNYKDPHEIYDEDLDRTYIRLPIVSSFVQFKCNGLNCKLLYGLGLMYPK